MKICLTCNRRYADETLNFCLDDGATLSVVHDRQVTQDIPPTRPTDQVPTEVLYAASKPSIQPTITAPPPPVLPAQQSRQSNVNQRSSAGLIVGVGILLLVLLAAVLAVWSMQSGKQKIANTSTVNVEYATDRPGADYRNYDLPEAKFELCRDACAGDPKCRAFTYVKPGVQGTQARCWLKTKVPPGGNSSCCISGTKQ